MFITTAAIALVTPHPALADDDVTYTLTLDANGGIFSSDAAGETGEFADSPLNSILNKTYAALANLPRPTRPYMRHTGWATTPQATDSQPQILPYETAKAAMSYPADREHAGLSDYTIEELSRVSAYLAELYESVGGNESDPLYIADKVYQEFHGYLTSGDDVYATWEPRSDTGEVLTLRDDNNTHLRLRVVGINHDDRADGNGKAGLTLMMTHVLPDEYRESMNLSNTNSGGWKKSHMRVDVLGNKNTLAEKPDGTLWNLLPDELADFIIPVDKLTNNDDVVDKGSVSTTIDYLWIPSHDELVGKDDTAYTLSYRTLDEGTVYESFGIGDTASRAKKRDALTYEYDGTVPESHVIYSAVWLRSPTTYSAYNQYFWFLFSEGRVSYSANAYRPYGTNGLRIVLGFCL